jgi:hypothetical protein
MAETAGWLSLGMGVAQIAHDAVAAGGNGVFVESDAISYHVGNYPAHGEEKTLTAAKVHVQSGYSQEDMHAAIDECYAIIYMSGTFAPAGENPPTLANVRLWCGHQSGRWGTGSSESELNFKAKGLPTPVGPSASEPHLQFQCRTELKIPHADNVIFHCVLDVDQWGLVTFPNSTWFEYGRCDTYATTDGLAVIYIPAQHSDTR